MNGIPSTKNFPIRKAQIKVWLILGPSPTDTPVQTRQPHRSAQLAECEVHVKVLRRLVHRHVIHVRVR